MGASREPCCAAVSELQVHLNESKAAVQGTRSKDSQKYTSLPDVKRLPAALVSACRLSGCLKVEVSQDAVVVLKENPLNPSVPIASYAYLTNYIAPRVNSWWGWGFELPTRGLGNRVPLLSGVERF